MLSKVYHPKNKKKLYLRKIKNVCLFFKYGSYYNLFYKYKNKF